MPGSQWWVGAMKRRARVQGQSPPLPCQRFLHCTPFGFSVWMKPHELEPHFSCSLILEGPLVFTLAVCCRWPMAEEVEVVICTSTLSKPWHSSAYMYMFLMTCLVCQNLECTCGNGEPRFFESYTSSWCFHSVRFEKTTPQHTFPKDSESQMH